MQAWCDTRVRAAARQPQWLSDAALYYYSQVGRGVKDERARDELRRWRESIAHKVTLVRLINLDTTDARLHATLSSHPSTMDARTYSADDRPRLSRRLVADAENELHLFLSSLYRLGYHRLLIYPFRPEAAPRARPAPGGPVRRARAHAQLAPSPVRRRSRRFGQLDRPVLRPPAAPPPQHPRRSTPAAAPPPQHPRPQRPRPHRSQPSAGGRNWPFADYFLNAR